MQPQVRINIEYLLATYNNSNDIKTDKDRLILQSTYNEIAEHKEYSRNCCGCRSRMFNYIKQYYNGQKEKNN